MAASSSSPSTARARADTSASSPRTLAIARISSPSSTTPAPNSARPAARTLCERSVFHAAAPAMSSTWKAQAGATAKASTASAQPTVPPRMAACVLASGRRAGCASCTPRHTAFSGAWSTPVTRPAAQAAQGPRAANGASTSATQAAERSREARSI